MWQGREDAVHEYLVAEQLYTDPLCLCEVRLSHSLCFLSVCPPTRHLAPQLLLNFYHVGGPVLHASK